MSSDSEGQGHSDPETDNSDEDRRSKSRSSSNDSNGGPETWQAPSMSQTMLGKIKTFNKTNQPPDQGDKSNISSEFVSTLSRVSKEKSPPPIPPKTFKRKSDSVEVETETKNMEREDQNMDLDDDDEGQQVLLRKQDMTREDSPKQNRLSVKEKAKMFEQPVQDIKSNPFAALKMSPVDIEHPVHEQKHSMVENSSDISDSMKEMEEKQTAEEQSIDDAQEDQTEVKTSPQQNTSSHGNEGHADKTSPQQNTDKTSPQQNTSSNGNEGQADKTSPWPQHQHPRIEQYPGPRSAHGWPGTPPAPQVRYPHQGAEPPKAPGYTQRPVHTPRGPSSKLQHLPPDPVAGGWNTNHGYNQYGYGYPQFGGPHPQFGHGTPGGAPPQFGYGTPGGVPPQYGHGTTGSVPPQYGYGTPGGAPGHGTPHGVPPQFGHGAPRGPPPQQFSHGTEESYTNQPPTKSEPGTTRHSDPHPGSNVKNPPRPKDVPLGKKGNHEKRKSGGKSPGAPTPKKGENRPSNRKDKETPEKDKSKDPKVEQKRPSPGKPQEPEKMYVCVSGIGEDVSNETVINYLEARSKMDIITDESLRREEDQHHAIVVFKDQIDLEVLTKACDSKRLKKCSLTFEEIDPPRNLMFSSEDDKLTEDSLRRYLSGKHLETVRVHETDEGSISVKLKEAKGVTDILKSTNIKIDRSNVVISVMYNCDHGTFWDHSLHRVAIPAPYQPTVLDKHVKSFIIDITSTCNERLEKHNARLSVMDEIHIECTLDPKDKQARQKVKTWKDNVKKAWDEFVSSNAQKKDLKITHDVKDLMVEHINSTKDRHTTEELKVIHDDDSLTIIFVGKSKIVENFHDQMSTKNREIQEHLKRQNKIRTESMKVEPIVVALMSKEKKFDQLDEIAPDFTYEVDQENGKITFTGVEEDISKAKVKIFENKNNFHSWTIRNLSTGQCKLLANEQVSAKVYEKLSDDNIPIVFEIGQDQVMVCITTEDNRKCVENVFKEIVLEEEIKLDETSKNVIVSDEWAEKKANLKNLFRDIAYIDDSADDKIVVMATCDVFDEIMDDLEQFIKEHSVYEETIKVKDEAEFRYLEMHCKNLVKDLKFKNSDQGLEIEFVNQAIEISGTKKSIESAKSEVDCQIRKIKKDQHSITKPGVDSLFNDKTKCADIIGPIEEESRTVILVDEASLTKSPFRRNTGRQETDEDYVRTQASKNYKRKGTKQTKDVKLKSGPVIYKNGTKITLVKKQDLGQQKADVIICSTNGQLDLTGPAGKCMVKAAGEEILGEIKQKYSDGIQHGDIAVVKGYKLQCTEVYLAALPGWSTGGEKVIQKCVNTCLIQASKYKSIVFPALGTGNLHYPRELVAEVMYQCIQKFDQSNSSLKDIKFLCYDTDTIKAFENEESKMMNPGYHPPAVHSSPGHYKKHNITMTVVKGDLGRQKVDVMVSAVPRDLNLESAGGAGISMMKGLGQSIQQDILIQHPNGVTSGGFVAVKLSSPVGKCKAVYLTSLDPWDQEKKVKDNDKQISKFVYKCLEQAERDGYKCIAIPAMGTGKIGYPHNTVATYMYDQVEKFASNNKKSQLSDVKFVVHNKDTKSIQAFFDEEKRRVPLPPPTLPVVQQTGAHGFATGGTSPNTDVTVKPINDNEFQVGSIKFSVEQGDILTKKCDVIVNGSNEDLDLSKGAVSQAIKKKCDAQKLDAEIAKKKDDMKQYGLVSTSGCGLPAKYIIHISSKHNPHEWKKMIKKALRKAEKKQWKTLAFPALGTGRGTDEEQMGKVIMESVIEFVGEEQITHLQHVYLVIFMDKMAQSMLKGVRLAGHTALSADKPKQVIKSANQQVCTVKFWIFSMSSGETDDAKQQLNRAVAEKFKTEKHHDRLLCELKPNELSYLQSVEADYPINLTIDQINNEVIIEGIIDHVTSAKQDVFDRLRKFVHTRHCEAEAEIVKDQAQWFLKDKDPMTGVMDLIPYPPMINMHLENAYKGDSNRSDVDFKDDQGEDYVIDLKTMTEYPLKNPKDKVDVIRREKLEGQGATFEPPPEWDEQGTENVKVVTLINTSPEYQSVEKKLVDSVKNGQYTKTSPDVRGKTLTVTKIERIQNLNFYRMYAAKRALLEKQNPNNRNEKELWHGCPESAVVSINLYGFNRSYCTVNSNDAWWGQGVYFANDASYSVRDFLTRPAASSERNIYLCLVLTGVSRKGTKHEQLRVLPTRTDGTMLPYDSNTDDQNPPLEFVVFNDTQAYPLYRIKFTLK